MCGEKVWGVGERDFPEFRPKSQHPCGMGGTFVNVGTITNLYLSPLQKLCRSFWHECCKLKTSTQPWHEGCIMQEACRSNVQNFDKAEVSSGRKLNTKTLMISTGYDELRHAVNYLNSSALSSSLEPRWTRRSLSSKSSESLGKMETSIFPQTDTILV